MFFGAYFMDDMERYGDYNEIDEVPGKKSPVGLVIKILVFLVCFSVAGVLLFRIALFNYYPAEIKELHYTESLNSYLRENESAKVETQSLRFPYDDAEKGNFFADNVCFVREAGQLQLSLRYNLSLIKDIESQYKVKLDPNDDIFEFSLAKTETGYISNKDDLDNDFPTETVGKLVDVKTDSFMMYRYYKLSFDEVDFGLDENSESVKWIRLEIRIKGVEMKEPYMLLIYENHDGFAIFEEIETISKGEK